jgi:hypothetical protein
MVGLRETRGAACSLAEVRSIERTRPWAPSYSARNPSMSDMAMFQQLPIRQTPTGTISRELSGLLPGRFDDNK